jgi:hypothetical protein
LSLAFLTFACRIPAAAAATFRASFVHTMKSSFSRRSAELTLVSAMISDEPGVNRAEISLRTSSGISTRSSTSTESSPSRLTANHGVLVLPGGDVIAVKTWVPSVRSGLRRATGMSKTLRKSCRT